MDGDRDMNKGMGETEGQGERRRDRDRDWDRWVVDAPAIFSHWKDAFGSQWIPYKFRNISFGSESL